MIDVVAYWRYHLSHLSIKCETLPARSYVGALKLVKCFYYLVSFEWNAQGQWRYAANEKLSEFSLCVPTVNGVLVSIEHLGVDVAKEILGVFVCPIGGADKQLETIKLKDQEWTSRAEDSKLTWRDVWFLVDHQLWPKLSYGLWSAEAPWEILEKVLVKRSHKVLPLGGVWRAAPKQLR